MSSVADTKYAVSLFTEDMYCDNNVYELLYNYAVFLSTVTNKKYETYYMLYARNMIK